MIANGHLIYLLNLYAEYIIRNDEPEVEMELKPCEEHRYVDDIHILLIG